MIDISCDSRPWKDFSLFVAIECSQELLLFIYIKTLKVHQRTRGWTK